MTSPTGIPWRMLIERLSVWASGTAEKEFSMSRVVPVHVASVPAIELPDVDVRDDTTVYRSRNVTVRVALSADEDAAVNRSGTFPPHSVSVSTLKQNEDEETVPKLHLCDGTITIKNWPRVRDAIERAFREYEERFGS